MWYFIWLLDLLVELLFISLMFLVWFSVITYEETDKDSLFFETYHSLHKG